MTKRLLPNSCGRTRVAGNLMITLAKKPTAFGEMTILKCQGARSSPKRSSPVLL